jgi:TRAP-type C4-dicarboxylate transport system permease small subunit
MNKQTGFINSVSGVIDKWVNYLVVGLIGGMVLVTTLQVIFRVFFTALSWTEEASRYLLVWSTFFGATLAYKRGSHIAITFAINKFPHKIKIGISVLSYLLSIVFFLAVSYYGFQMIKMQTWQISPAMSIPMKYVYLGIPVSLMIMVVHAVDGITAALREYAGKDDAA